MTKFIALFLLTLSLSACTHECECEEKEKWKPKPKPLKVVNKHLFYTKGYNWIIKAECGKKKVPCCHTEPNDPGHFTCLGISIKYNQEVYARIVQDSYSKHKKIRLPSLGKPKHRYVFNMVPAEEVFKDTYYNKYFKQFDECPFDIALQLTDSQILSGHAARIFQRSQGLKADGIFGPQSIKKCNSSPDMAAFKQARLKRLQSLKICKHFCAGWHIRLNNLDKYIKEAL